MIYKSENDDRVLVMQCGKREMIQKARRVYCLRSKDSERYERG